MCADQGASCSAPMTATRARRQRAGNRHPGRVTTAHANEPCCRPQSAPFLPGGRGVFLLYLALGHLPALFAVPAGLGDIAAGIAAPLVARRLARGTGRRAALWFNAFGMTDLVVALTLGALTGFQLLNVTPSSAPITELPLALIPAATVPLFFALHITATSALASSRRTPVSRMPEARARE